MRVLSTLLEQGWTLASDLMSSQDVDRTDMMNLGRYKYIKARVKGARTTVDLSRDYAIPVLFDHVLVDLTTAGRRVACSPEQQFKTPFLTRSPHRLDHLIKASGLGMDIVKILLVDRQINCQVHAVGLDAQSLDCFDPRSVIVYLTERGRRYLPRRLG
jgi:hypothetical protein